MPKAVLHSVKCITCGKLFETDLYNKKFCSNECRNKFHFQGGELTKKFCPYCGSIFETAKRNKKYCSDECRDKANFLIKDNVIMPSLGLEEDDK